MDNLSWENPVAIRTEVSLWSDHHDNITDSSEGYNTSFKEKLELNEALLSSSLELERILAALQTSSSLDRISERVEISTPSFGLGLMQHPDSVLMRPVVGATLWDAASSPTIGASEELHVSSKTFDAQDDLSAIFSSCKNGHGSLDRHQAGVTSHCSSRKPSNKRKFDEFTRIGENNHIRSLLESNSSSKEGGFQISFTRGQKLGFVQEGDYEIDNEAIAQVKEMIYRAAALRPVSLVAEEAAEKPKRKNVRISSDPQTVAARKRRERISEKLRVLQRMVPGGSKMDTASMLDEAANYVKFLKSQVMALEALDNSWENDSKLQAQLFCCMKGSGIMTPMIKSPRTLKLWSTMAETFPQGMWQRGVSPLIRASVPLRRPPDTGKHMVGKNKHMPVQSSLPQVAFSSPFSVTVQVQW